VLWPDEETGLPCLAIRHSSFGHWCGYVGVPERHRFYGVDYDTCEVDVHGGLLSQTLVVIQKKAHGLCHIPDKGESDKVWWLGFDYAHLGDLSPGMMKFKTDLGFDVYKDLNMVKAECKSLAQQIK